ncbi:MAG: TolC family protein [Planctomycetota bacterium]
MVASAALIGALAPGAVIAQQGVIAQEAQPRDFEDDALREAAAAAPPVDPEPQVEPGAPVLALTLIDALDIALSNNLTLAVEELNAETADLNRRGSWGAFDPVFGLTASYQDAEQPQANTIITGGAPAIENEDISLDANLTAPITTGGSFRLGFVESLTDTNNPGITSTFEDGTFANAVLSAGYTQPLLRGAWARAATADQRESEIEVRVRQAALEAVRNQVLTDVSNAYWDLVAAREQERVQVNALELAREQLMQNSERLRVGVGTEVDVLQAETQVAQEEEALLRARADVRARSDALKALILRRSDDTTSAWDEYLDLWGLPIEPLTDLPPVESMPELDTDGNIWRAALDEALELRPELQQALYEIDRAEVRLDRARSDRLPGLDLNLDANSSSFEDTVADAFETATELEFITYSGSLGFQVPLGNRSAKYAERAARAALRTARLQLEQTEANVVSEIRDAVRAVETEAQAVLAAAKSSAFTQRQLEAEQARYKEGLATTFQVLEFQQQLVEAQSAENAALANHAKALVALERARGTIVDRLRELKQRANDPAE